MRKVVAVIRREFTERVRTKWFWIGTILGPVFFGGMIVLQLLLASQRGGERRVAVVDGTTTGAGTRLVEGLRTVIRRFQFTRIQDSPSVPDSLTRAVVGKGLHGFLIISDSTLEAGTAEYRGSNVSSITDMRELQAALSRQVFAIRLERQGIDPVVV
ncbi:MAG: ABC transporter permease, partial [bacterium]